MSALLLIGCVLRPLFLGARSLWFDEASTLILAGLPLSRLCGLLVRNEMNPPLYYALMHFWVKAFSDPRIGLRCFSALCGIASLVVFKSLVERVLPARARLLALFLAAFSSSWLHAAQDGRVYAFLLLIALLTARVVWDLGESPSPRRWAAYALLCALGLHAHYYFAFPFAAHAAWLGWRFRRSPRELRAWLAAHAAAAALFAPWAWFVPGQLRLHVGDLVLGDALTPFHLADTLGAMFFDVTYLGLALPSWLVAAIGAGFAATAAAGAALARSERADAGRRALRFALFHLAAPIVLIGLAELALGRPVTQARYFYPLSPFAFLIAAAVLSSESARARLPRLALEAVAAAGVAGYFASGVLVDPHLDRLAAAIRGASDRRMPIAYLEIYYYLPMRVYYLPERVHLLAAGAARGMAYAEIPPYDGVADQRRLRGLGPCVVVDEQRRVSSRPRWIGTGAALAGLIAAAGPSSARGR